MCIYGWEEPLNFKRLVIIEKIIASILNINSISNIKPFLVKKIKNCENTIKYHKFFYAVVN